MNRDLPSDQTSVNHFSDRQAVRLIWSKNSLSAAAKSVAACLVRHANKCGVCWPAVMTICDETGFKRRAVLYALKELENSKDAPLTVKHTKRFDGAGKQISNCYQLEIRGALRARTGVHGVESGGAQDAPKLRSEIRTTKLSELSEPEPDLLTLVSRKEESRVPDSPQVESPSSETPLSESTLYPTLTVETQTQSVRMKALVRERELMVASGQLRLPSTMPVTLRAKYLKPAEPVALEAIGAPIHCEGIPRSELREHLSGIDAILAAVRGESKAA